MRVQRMTLDPKIGFNYDYMGFAEFEFGVTTRARAALARAWLDGALVGTRTLVETRCDPSFAALVVTTTECRDLLPNPWRFSPDKTGLRPDAPFDFRAWMPVEVQYPLFILKDDANLKDGLRRLELFLKPFVDEIAKEVGVTVGEA